MSAAPREIDRLFSVFEHPIRRHLVSILDERTADELSGEAVLDVLTDRLNEPRQDLRVTLHHVHAPKLAAGGVITYDEGTGEVRGGPRFEAAARLLARAE